jgi:HAD superfamily hydrolase (TIGR01509 family)
MVADVGPGAAWTGERSPGAARARGRDNGRVHAAGPDTVRAVVFDFDGLLMDTESTLFLSWQYEWSQWGLALSERDFFADHGGDVTEERYALLAAAAGPHYDRELSHRRRLAYRDRLHEDLDLADGLRQWLEEADGLGLRLAVASSSPRDWLTAHLGRTGALPRFAVLAAGDEVTRHKPAPDVYELALARLGLSGAAAVAVEDTAHGVAAARAAGMRCIAIPNPYVAAERVSHAGLVQSSAAELPLAQALGQLR